jgi:hypothetical protein
MTFDLAAANYTLSGLRPFPVAVTTVHEGRANGLISLSAGAAAIVPEAPRVTISLTKYNLTHDLVLNSGAFVMHLLAATPEPALEASLDVQESTIFVADVVGAERLRAGERLRIGPAWEKLPKEWIERYEANHVPQLESARRNRGLTE